MGGNGNTPGIYLVDVRFGKSVYSWSDTVSGYTQSGQQSLMLRLAVGKALVSVVVGLEGAFYWDTEVLGLFS